MPVTKEKYRESKNAQAREARKAWSEEKRASDKEWHKRWWANNKRKAEGYYRLGNWRKHGMLNEEGQLFNHTDYDRLYQIQQGRCFICKKHQTDLKNRLNVDHDHSNRKVRGLLCSQCNAKVGVIENIDFVHTAILYLRRES